MKPKLYTVTGTAEINGETLEVWADVGPRGAIKEVRSYRTQTLNDGEQVHHNDIFKKSEWSGFQLADLDPSRVGDNDKLPENLKELLS